MKKDKNRFALLRKDDDVYLIKFDAPWRRASLLCDYGTDLNISNNDASKIINEYSGRDWRDTPTKGMKILDVSPGGEKKKPKKRIKGVPGENYNAGIPPDYLTYAYVISDTLGKNNYKKDVFKLLGIK